MLKKWCEVTSLNGVIDLYESKGNKCELAFWACVMSMMAISSVYFTFMTVTYYINNPSATNIESIHPNRLDLPEVMVCYRGGLNFSAMLEEGLSVELIQGLSTYLQTNLSEEATEQLNHYRLKNKFTLKDVYEKFSVPCSEMIEMFQIPTTDRLLHYIEDTRCNESLLLPSRTGPCYIFKNNGEQIYPSYSGGVVLILKEVNNSGTKSIFSKKQFRKAGLLNGFTVSLEKEFCRLTSGRDLFIPMNSVVAITLNTKLYTRLEKFNKCDKAANVTPNTCFFRCYIKEMNRNCNCMDLDYADFDLYPDIDVCSPNKMLTCDYNFEELEKCHRSCKPQCEEWLFETSVTYSTSEADEEGQGSSSVYIGYNTMQYTKIEEVESFTFDMAVSNIGGQSGLWLGASFVTVIQGLYYLVLAICRKNSQPVNLTVFDSKT